MKVNTLHPLPSLRRAHTARVKVQVSGKLLRADGACDKQCKFDVALRCREADNNLCVNILAEMRRRIFTRAAQTLPTKTLTAQTLRMVINPVVPGKRLKV